MMSFFGLASALCDSWRLFPCGNLICCLDRPGSAKDNRLLLGNPARNLGRITLGMLAEFFVADPTEAMRYVNRMDELDEGEEIECLVKSVQFNGVTGLEIGTLWAILESTQWDVKKHMPIDVDIDEEGESWLCRFPDELTRLLASSDEGGLASASEQWAKTEELNCDPADLLPLLEDLQSLSQQAVAKGQSIYLYSCL